jgi:rhamnosyltransferase
MNPERIAAVTIFYNPSEDVVENINSYVGLVDILYLVDNSPNETPFLKSLSSEKTRYFHDGQNDGIAKRLNEAASMAKSVGFNFLLTMDQDSSFENAMLNNYLSCFNKNLLKTTTAVFGIENDKRLLVPGECKEKEEQILITSGSILNLDIHTRLNGFDENLFIDYVDTEYCLRAMQAGFNTTKFPNILLNHTIGTHRSFYSLKSLKRTNRSLHSPVRVYYMWRNYLYISKKYKTFFPDYFKRFKKNLMQSLKNNFLYNRERIQVMVFLIKGLKDFRKGKMGRM